MYWEAWPAKGSADDLTLDTANSVSRTLLPSRCGGMLKILHYST